MPTETLLEQEEVIEAVPTVDYDYTTCRGCELWKTSIATLDQKTYRRSGIYGRGTGENGLMLIAEAPGATEIVRGTPLVGPSGRLLSEYLKSVGIDEGKCWVDNVCHCRPVNNKNPSVAQIRVCAGLHLEKSLPHPGWRPRLIVLLGTVPLKFILDKQGLTERRGIFYDGEFLGAPTKVLPTYHPSRILRSSEMGAVFKQDLIKARQFLLGEKAAPLPPIRRSNIRTQEQYQQWMSFFLGLPQGHPIECDIEATGLNFLKDTITSISLTTYFQERWYGCAFLTFQETHTDKQFVEVWERIQRLEKQKEGLLDMGELPKDATVAMVDVHIKATQDELLRIEPYWYLDLTQKDSLDFDCLKTILETYHITYHNGNFDTKFFWKAGIHTENFFDTMDAHLMINEVGPHNLKSLVVEHMGDSAGYQHVFQDSLGDKTQYHTAPPEILLTYNGDDGFYTGLLRQRFAAEMIEEETADLFKTQAMPLARTLTRLTYRGIQVNKEYLHYLAGRYRKLVKEKRTELFETAHLSPKFNDASPAQLGKLLYHDIGLPVVKLTKTTKAPSTDKGALKELAALHPVPKMIVDLRKLRKLCVYLDGNDGVEKDKPQDAFGLLGHMDENDRIHTTLLTIGTNSGRLSSVDPNLQNIPKNKEFRDLFIANPGWVIINADYSQAEMWMLAFLSGDPALQRAVQQGDMHSATYRDLYHLPPDAPVPDDKRKIMKIVNFRIAYRGGYKALAAQLGLEETEAKLWYDNWDRAYPVVKRWWAHQDAEWMTKGYITSIFGRKRRFPLSELQMLYAADPRKYSETKAFFDRIAVNFPCQSGVGDLNNRTLILFDQEMEKRYGWAPETCLLYPGAVLAVHDEVLIECPEDKVDDTSKILREVMLRPLPELGISLPIELEVKKSWGEGVIGMLGPDEDDDEDLEEILRNG